MSQIASTIPIQPVEHRPPLKPINFRPVWTSQEGVAAHVAVSPEQCARIWQAVVDTARGVNPPYIAPAEDCG